MVSGTKGSVEIAWIVIVVSEVSSVVEWRVVVVPEIFKSVFFFEFDIHATSGFVMWGRRSQLLVALVVVKHANFSYHSVIILFCKMQLVEVPSITIRVLSADVYRWFQCKDVSPLAVLG